MAKFKPRVRVRMYQQGLGDCFLLRFETEPKTFYDVLIDCGIYKASPGAADVMREVVADVVATTKDAAHKHGHLDLLVVTHEHWDHISGFDQARDLFEKMRIDATWQAWTEDEDDPVAKELLKRYRKAKAGLVTALRAAAKRPGASGRALDEAFEIMSFFGVDKGGDEEDAYARIKALLAAKNPRCLSPGTVEPLGDTGVKAFVLGPPKDADRIKKDDPGSKHGYHKQKQAFFDAFATALSAADPDGDDANGHPFNPRLEIPLDAARASEFFQAHYGFDDDPEHPSAYRSIDDLAGEALGQLALRLDSHLNNTSLVLALRLPNGNVLLFPGDAQAGNWLSWADLEKPLVFKKAGPDKEDVDAHQLLANTVYYKVSHHGSHNASPKTYGIELMTNPDLRACVPVDGEVAGGAGYGEMPLVEILDALHGRTRGRVARSDDATPNGKGAFTYSPKTLTLRQKKGGPQITRPLWCETSFEL